MNTETATTTETETPRAWVGCLGCYNSGDLVGEWMDSHTAGDAVLWSFVRQMNDGRELCARCGSDEFWVFDHEGLPDGVLSGECSPCQFAEVATAWESVDDPEMFAAYLGNVGEAVTADNVAELIEQAEERYTGYATVTEYAENYLEESGLLAEVPESLRYYIDAELFARDLELGGDVSEVDGYVFLNY